jgi:hypothetical protein
MRYRDIIKENGGLVVPGVNTTPDVQPGEIARQAAKLGFKVDANGLPPIWTGHDASTGAKDTPNKGEAFYKKNGARPNKKAPKLKKNVSESVLVESLRGWFWNANTGETLDIPGTQMMHVEYIKGYPENFGLSIADVKDVNLRNSIEAGKLLHMVLAMGWIRCANSFSGHTAFLNAASKRYANMAIKHFAKMFTELVVEITENGEAPGGGVSFRLKDPMAVRQFLRTGVTGEEWIDDQLSALTEARRNPEQNRGERNQGFGAALKNYIGPDSFISFTMIDKVGANPRTQFSTPIGIYTYPLDEETWQDVMDDDIPFAGDLKYINIIKSRASKVMDSANYAQGDMVSNEIKLRECLLDYWMEDPDGIYQFLKDAQTSAFRKKNSPFMAMTWNQTRWVAMAISTARKNKTLDPEKRLTLVDVANHVAKEYDDNWNSNPQLWNHVLSNVLGYDMILDRGAGIIHSNEPKQALFLKLSALQLMERKINPNWNEDAKTEKKITMGYLPLLIGTERLPINKIFWGINTAIANKRAYDNDQDMHNALGGKYIVTIKDDFNSDFKVFVTNLLNHVDVSKLNVGQAKSLNIGIYEMFKHADAIRSLPHDMVVGLCVMLKKATTIHHGQRIALPEYIRGFITPEEVENINANY